MKSYGVITRSYRRERKGIGEKERELERKEGIGTIGLD